MGEGHDSDRNVAKDISVHPSIAAMRDKCVVAAFEVNHVSMAETELILKSLDPNKATGNDQIPARHVLSSREMMSLTSLNTGLHPS